MTLLKKTVYDKLVAKVDDIDTSGSVLKTKCDKSDLEKKISNVDKKIQTKNRSRLLLFKINIWKWKPYCPCGLSNFFLNMLILSKKLSKQQNIYRT